MLPMACHADVPLAGAITAPSLRNNNPPWRAVLGTAPVLAVLGPAIAIGSYAATRWNAPLDPGRSG